MLYGHVAAAATAAAAAASNTKPDKPRQVEEWPIITLDLYENDCTPCMQYTRLKEVFRKKMCMAYSHLYTACVAVIGQHFRNHLRGQI